MAVPQVAPSASVDADQSLSAFVERALEEYLRKLGQDEEPS
jgi:hypothetical protein